jgi:hypothetical protein
MTLENIVLRKLAETKPSSERHNVLVTDGPWTVTVTADRRDDLSSRVWQLELERREAMPGGVVAWADRIAKNVSGLMETLKVVEVDAPKQEAILRSARPAQKGEDLFYYEVHLRAARASLRRYQAAQGGKARQPIAFAVTNETIAKLVADVTAEK